MSWSDAHHKQRGTLKLPFTKPQKVYIWKISTLQKPYLHGYQISIHVLTHTVWVPLEGYPQGKVKKTTWRRN